MKDDAITITATANAPIETVWKCWNEPEHIIHWAFASSDWAAPHAENDLRTGGKFLTRMEAKDKSEGFDFEGIYSAVKEHEIIEYDMSDGRHVMVSFENTPDGTKITETFDPESENPTEIQRAGWQAILGNFKRYTEKEVAK